MASRTGKVILSKNIKLDRNYKNVINYTEQQMVNLCTANAVYTTSDCSFLREGARVLDINISYADAIKCNYLAFQNPDYSNKWFFAFIDGVEYRNQGMCRISFTIDEFATWFDYWNPKTCFVVREHVNDDTVGSNLVPENLETGEYIQQPNTSIVGVGFAGRYYYVLQTTKNPVNDSNMTAVNVGGIATAGGLVIFPYWQNMYNIINDYYSNNKLDSIYNAYLVPETLFPDDVIEAEQYVPAQQYDPDAWAYYKYLGSNEPVSQTSTISMPTTIDDYTPKNNKLLTAPFQMFMISNNSGSVNSYAYEYFSDRNNIEIVAKGTPVIGCSIIVYPKNYKGIVANYNEALTAGKFPTLSWSGDSFTNWLTQNSVNLGLGVVNDIATIATVPFSEDKATAVFGIGTSIVNQINSVYQHSLVPTTVRGNTNGGDVMTSLGDNNCWLYKMSIRSEFAHKIDHYFTRFGYKINDIKVPNQTGRRYWNYVEIASGEDIGNSNNNNNISVPSDSMETINNAYRSGITIWHNHDNIGNFGLDNAIV